MSTDPAADKLRIQKALSRAGHLSRRHAEILISQGRIRVNGQRITEMGTQVTPGRDIVSIDEKVVPLDSSSRYLMLHKPKGVISSLSDDRGRPDLSSFVTEIGERVVNVGRLDADTTGLLLMTNDGDLTHRLSHPSFEISKSYLATVRGAMGNKKLRQLRSGVELEDGIMAADSVKVVGELRGSVSIIEIVIHSGRNRVVRRLMESIGNPVLSLHRKSIAGVHLGGLKVGRWRDLSGPEIQQFLTVAYRSSMPPQEKRNPQ